MAGRFWFGKRNIGDSSNQSIGEADENNAVIGAVLDQAVFPTGLDEEDEADEISIKSPDEILDDVRRSVELVKKKIVDENKKIENNTSTPQDYDKDDNKSREQPVNISGNKSIKFTTRSIPGVIDGGRPDGHPVLTPVRHSASAAPVKLKSVAERDAERLASDKVEVKKPTTSALKVVNKAHKSTPVEDQPKFGLHVRSKDLTQSSESVEDRSEAPAEYIKPQSDQRVLYYQLMNGLYDAVLVLDDHGHVVDCNERVLKVLGYSREDAWDLPIDDVIKGMNSQMFAHLKRNLAESHHVLITARCYKSNGDSFKGEIGVSTLSLTRENNVVFAIRNVDQRKSAMAELRKSASAFEVALVPAFACSLEGFFTVVNKALMDSFGIPDDAEAKKVRFIDILPDAARAFAKSVTGEKVHETIVVSAADGQHVRVEISLAPIVNGRDVIGVAGSILQL